MRTADQIKADLEHARTIAAHAPNAESAAWDQRTVSALEAELRAIEQQAGSEELERVTNELKRERIRADRAEKRLEHREWLLAQIIGRPLDGMTQVAIGGAVHEVLGNLRTTQ